MDETESRSITLDTSTLEFLALQVGEGPRHALLFHGFPDDPRSFLPLMHRLADMGYTCTAPYMRGYGQTETPPLKPGNYAVTDLASDVMAVASAVDADDPLVVGHDWGAIASAAVARLDPTFGEFVVASVPPDFTEALADDPLQVMRSWYMAAFQMPDVSEEFLRSGDYRLIEHLWRTWSPKLDDGDRVEEVKETFRQGDTTEAALLYYRSFFQDVLPGADDMKIRGIEAPTLLLSGSSDGCIPSSMFEDSGRCFSGRFEHRTLNAGHFLQYERPDEVAEAIQEFHGKA